MRPFNKETYYIKRGEGKSQQKTDMPSAEQISPDWRRIGYITKLEEKW
jgi:hypothetical protein